MLEALKEHIMALSEEITYRESVLRHKKSLEASLWGLEEQIRMPENQSAQDQEEIAIQINTCQGKIINCNRLLDGHVKKLMNMNDQFKLSDHLAK